MAVFAVAVLEMLVQAGYWLCCFLLGRIVVRRLAPGASNSAVGVASAAAMGFAIVGLLTLGLGLAGWLSSACAWGLLGVALAAGLWDARGELLALQTTSLRDRVAGWLKARSEGGWIWLAVSAAVSVAVVGASLAPGTLWRPDDPHPYDSLEYHLQVPREWFEAGRIIPLQHNVFSFFPFNVEIHYLLADYLRGGPWAAAYQAQFLSLWLTLLTALAVWGWARNRCGRPAAALAAAAILTLPWVVMLGCVSYVESGMLLLGALAIIWFLQAMRDPAGSVRPFVLAGALAGLACGVKLTNVPMILISLPLAGMIVWALGRKRELPVGRMLRGCAVFVACGLVALSPWLLRNAAWTSGGGRAGNPLFPVAMRQLGQAHFTDTQVERFERAHRPAPAHAPWPARLGRAASEIAVNWRYNYVLFPLAVVAFACAWRSVEARVLIVLLLLILVFWLTNTHLMGRFFVLGAVVAAMLLAMIPARARGIGAGILMIAAACSFAGPTLSLPGGDSGNLHALLAPQAAGGQMGLFGLEDYSLIESPELRPAMESEREVVFVGDAQMFLHPSPMARLRYCTVFDLNLDAGRDWVDASYGPARATCPESAVVVINPAECQRLARTYYNVGELTPAATSHRERVVVLGR